MANIYEKQMVSMTISEYCNIHKVNQRYLRRIVTANKKQLLNDSYGIADYRLFGKTYILTVQKDFVKEKGEIDEKPTAKAEIFKPQKLKATAAAITKRGGANLKVKNKTPKSSVQENPEINKKSPTVISLKDAKNMVKMGVATCSSGIKGKDGNKEHTSFTSVEEALKTRSDTNSNGHIWIWNKETLDTLYIVGTDGKAY